eukprot:Phypoly_transcript_25140.p2 GENE.Phypoly_transcript_25140~~Phypoly_transcript_25140.p2  ORF type:complete len:102 (-),score=3.51 Phypoly_transcript_25140:38-343(-)
MLVLFVVVSMALLVRVIVMVMVMIMIMVTFSFATTITFTVAFIKSTLFVKYATFFGFLLVHKLIVNHIILPLNFWLLPQMNGYLPFRNRGSLCWIYGLRTP